MYRDDPYERAEFHVKAHKLQQPYVSRLPCRLHDDEITSADCTCWQGRQPQRRMESTANWMQIGQDGTPADCEPLGNEDYNERETQGIEEDV